MAEDKLKAVPVELALGEVAISDVETLASGVGGYEIEVSADAEEFVDVDVLLSWDGGKNFVQGPSGRIAAGHKIGFAAQKGYTFEGVQVRRVVSPVGKALTVATTAKEVQLPEAKLAQAIPAVGIADKDGMLPLREYVEIPKDESVPETKP